MDTPLQITFRDFPHSDAAEAQVRQHVAKLETLFDHIVACRVVLQEPHRQHRHGSHFQVRIDITVPHSELVVTRSSDDDTRYEDLYSTIDKAFGEAERQLRDYSTRLRADRKHSLRTADHGPGLRPG